MRELLVEHQYVRVTKTKWVCYCSGVPRFDSFDELTDHLVGALAKFIAGPLTEKAVVDRCREKADYVRDNPQSSVWQHPADAALVEYVTVLLGLDDE